MSSSSSVVSRSFTLLELLVVIGIIAVLAAMTMPALSRARAVSRRVSCTGNMRQIGLGLEMYVSDYEYRLPVCSSSHAPDAGPFIRDVLLDYCGHEEKVFVCPSDPLGKQREGGSYDWNYLVNGELLNEKTMMLTRFGNIEMPIMSDIDHFHNESGKADSKNWLYFPLTVTGKLTKPLPTGENLAAR